MNCIEGNKDEACLVHVTMQIEHNRVISQGFWLSSCTNPPFILHSYAKFDVSIMGLAFLVRNWSFRTYFLLFLEDELSKERLVFSSKIYNIGNQTKVEMRNILPLRFKERSDKKWDKLNDFILFSSMNRWK